MKLRTVIGGILAAVIAWGVYRIVRIVIATTLLIYGASLAVTIVPDSDIKVFLSGNFLSMAKLFVVLVALWVLFLKKNWFTIGRKGLRA